MALQIIAKGTVYKYTNHTRFFLDDGKKFTDLEDLLWKHIGHRIIISIEGPEEESLGLMEKLMSLKSALAPA